MKCIFYQYELCAELLYSLTFPCIGMFFLQNEAEHKWMRIILNGEWKMFCYIITCKLRSFLLNMEFILGKRSSSVSHVQLFCDCKDCSPLGSSVHGILQAILEWVDISFSKGIFLTQGSNSGLLHCRQVLCCLSHQENPSITFELSLFLMPSLPSYSTLSHCIPLLLY